MFIISSTSYGNKGNKFHVLSRHKNHNFRTLVKARPVPSDCNMEQLKKDGYRELMLFTNLELDIEKVVSV